MIASFVAALAATFIAGLASFIAPCTLPLIPAYFAYASGIGAAELAGQGREPGTSGAAHGGRLVAGTVLFVLGFSTVFVLLGVGAGGIGRTLQTFTRPVEIVGGLLLLLFGLFLVGARPLRFMNAERRMELPAWLLRAGVPGAFAVGIVFGIGWTPCVGPFLGAALALAAVSGHELQGALLLATYSLGLGLPFVVLALLWSALPTLNRRLMRLAPATALVGGVTLAVLGLLLVTGQYTHLTSLLATVSVPR